MADEVTTSIEAPTAPERPDWLPDQFKAPEDLAKSYDEVRRETDRLREENRRQGEQFAEALARIEADRPVAPAYSVGQDPLVAQYAQALENGDAATALAIQVAISQQATAQVIDQKLSQLAPAMSAREEEARDVAFTMAQDRMARQYGDRWTELQPQVFERLRNDQRLLPQSASVDGYAMAMIEQANVIDAARIVAANDAQEADRRTKLAAQGISGSTSRGGPPTDADKAAWAEVQNAPTNSYADLFKK